MIINHTRWHRSSISDGFRAVEVNGQKRQFPRLKVFVYFNYILVFNLINKALDQPIETRSEVYDQRRHLNDH